MQDFETLSTIGTAMNVIRFLSLFVHGLVNGKREDLLKEDIENAKAQFEILLTRLSK